MRLNETETSKFEATKSTATKSNSPKAKPAKPTQSNSAGRVRAAARKAILPSSPHHSVPQPGGTERAIRELEDATHRYAARRLRDSLPGKITTRRLVLRALTRGDVPDLVRLANNKAIAERLAVLPHPYTSRDALAFIEDFSQRPSQRPYAITLRDRFIGVVGLAFPETSAPELGYWLGEPFWGQGYGTEAAKALVDAAFATRHVELLAARALAENTASLGVLGKLGFVRTGEDTSPHALSFGKPRVLLELRRPRWM